MSQPIPLKNGPSNSKPRRVSTSSRSSRRRSFSTVKEQPSTWAAPPLARSQKLREGEDDESDDDAPDGEVKPSKVRGKRTKKGEVYQCEKCSKWYRHPACLTKHRWQHTDYWQSTASLMMSKHQSVMMLEAAAILTNAGSLPEEKSFWPAAVSPPQSGLLGSDNFNSEVLRGHRGGTEVGSPGYNSFASLPPTDHMHHSSDETEDTSPDSLDDYYSESQHDTRDTSPADGSKDHNDEDEEEMFALDMGDLKVVEEEPEPGQPAPPQRVQLPPFGAHQRMNQSPLPSIQSSSRWVGNDWAKRETGLPYSELGISAPSMGFFEPRRQTGFGTPAPGTSPPMATTTEERSSAAWGSQ